jgi:thiol:disulfide interchange protein DsbA
MKAYITGLFVALSCVARIACASPAAPQAGVDYQVFATPAALPAHAAGDAAIKIPAASGKAKKSAQAVVEVTEFFWYGCPHCATLESQLLVWLKQKGNTVRLKRVPVAFSKDLEAHQRLYHALVAMGLPPAKIAALNTKIFKAIQIERNYLLTPDVQAQFLAKEGIAPAQFLAAYSSNAVTRAVAEDAALTEKYHMDGVPALLVDNQYLTSPAMADSIEGSIQIMDFLVRKVQSQNVAR